MLINCDNSHNIKLLMVVLLARKPIDFGGQNHHQLLATDYQGYIISHIGKDNYRINRNCSITLEGLNAGDNFSISILKNDLKSKRTCKDSLTIIGGETNIKICGNTSTTQWNKTLKSPELLFWFRTDGNAYVGSFQIEYRGKLNSSICPHSHHLIFEM